MNWLEWIKANKPLSLGILALVVGGICVATGVITWEQFLGLFERVQSPIEGGG